MATGDSKDFLVNVELQVQDKASPVIIAFKGLIESVTPSIVKMTDAVTAISTALSGLEKAGTGISANFRTLGSSSLDSSIQLNQLALALKRVRDNYDSLKETATGFKLQPITQGKTESGDSASFQQSMSGANKSSSALAKNAEEVTLAMPAMGAAIQSTITPINGLAISMDKAILSVREYAYSLRYLSTMYGLLKESSNIQLKPITPKADKAQGDVVGANYAESVRSASTATSGLNQSLNTLDTRITRTVVAFGELSAVFAGIQTNFIRVTTQVKQMGDAFAATTAQAAIMGATINAASTKTAEFGRAKKDLEALVQSVSGVVNGVRQVEAVPLTNIGNAAVHASVGTNQASTSLKGLAQEASFVSNGLVAMSQKFLGIGLDSKTALGQSLAEFHKLEVELSKFNSGSITMGIGLMAVGGGLVAPFAAATKVATDLEREMSRVQAATEATAPQLEQIKLLAIELGKATPFSAREAAEGFRRLAMAGLDVKQATEALPVVLNVAAAGFMSIEKAADLTTGVMLSYGMSAGQMSNASDVLTKAAIKSNSSLEELGTSFKYIGSVAKTAGISFESTTSALALLHNAGLKGSMAGTALRGMLERLMNPTKAEADVLKELSDRIGGTGLKLTEASGKFVSFSEILRQFEVAGVSTSEIFKIFGQRAGPGFAALLEQGSAKMKEYENGLINVNGYAAKVAGTMRDNVKGAFENMMSSMEALGDAVGKHLLPFFRALLDTATGVINWVTDLANKFPILTTVITYLAAGLGGLTLALGTVMFGWFMLGIGAEKGIIVMKRLITIVAEMGAALLKHALGLDAASAASQSNTVARLASAAAWAKEATEEEIAAATSLRNAESKLRLASAVSASATASAAQSNANFRLAQSELAVAEAALISAEAEHKKIGDLTTGLELNLATEKAERLRANAVALETEALVANTAANQANVSSKTAQAEWVALKAMQEVTLATEANTTSVVVNTAAQTEAEARLVSLAIAERAKAQSTLIAAESNAYYLTQNAARLSSEAALLEMEAAKNATSVRYLTQMYETSKVEAFRTRALQVAALEEINTAKAVDARTAATAAQNLANAANINYSRLQSLSTAELVKEVKAAEVVTKAYAVSSAELAAAQSMMSSGQAAVSATRELAVARAADTAAIAAHNLLVMEATAATNGLTGTKLKEALAHLVNARALAGSNIVQTASVAITDAAMITLNGWTLALARSQGTIMMRIMSFMGLTAATTELAAAQTALNVAEGASVGIWAKIASAFSGAMVTGLTTFARGLMLVGTALRFVFAAAVPLAVLSAVLYGIYKAYQYATMGTNDYIKANEEEKTALDEKNKALLDASSKSKQYVSDLRKLKDGTVEYYDAAEKLANMLPNVSKRDVTDETGRTRTIVANLNEAEEAAKKLGEAAMQINFQKAIIDIDSMKRLLSDEEKAVVAVANATLKLNAARAAVPKGQDPLQNEAYLKLNVELTKAQGNLAAVRSQADAQRDVWRSLASQWIESGGNMAGFIAKFGPAINSVKGLKDELTGVFQQAEKASGGSTFLDKMGSAASRMSAQLNVAKADVARALQDIKEKLKTQENEAGTIYKNMSGLWKDSLDTMKVANQATWDLMTLEAHGSSLKMAQVEEQRVAMMMASSTKWLTSVTTFYQQEIEKAKAKGVSTAQLEKDLTDAKKNALKDREAHLKTALEKAYGLEKENTNKILELRKDQYTTLMDEHKAYLDFIGEEKNSVAAGEAMKTQVREQASEINRALQRGDYELAKTIYKDMSKNLTEMKKDFQLNPETMKEMSGIWKTAEEGVKGLNKSMLETELQTRKVNDAFISTAKVDLKNTTTSIQDIAKAEQGVSSEGLQKLLQVDTSKLAEVQDNMVQLMNMTKQLNQQQVKIEVAQSSVQSLAEATGILNSLQRAYKSVEDAQKKGLTGDSEGAKAQAWEQSREALTKLADEYNKITNLVGRFGEVTKDSSKGAQQDALAMMEQFKALETNLKSMQQKGAESLAPKILAGDFMAVNGAQMDEIQKVLKEKFKVDIKPAFKPDDFLAEIGKMRQAATDQEAIKIKVTTSGDDISEKLVTPAKTFRSIAEEAFNKEWSIKLAYSNISDAIGQMNTLLEKMAQAEKRAADLARYNANGSSATIGIRGNAGGAVPGYNLGGMIQHFAEGGAAMAMAAFAPLASAAGPGNSSLDTVPAMLTPGEFVIREPMVKRYGSQLFHAFNSGLIKFANMGGHIRGASSPVVQSFNSGGGVHSAVKSRDSVDVNLNIGGNSFPLTGSPESVRGLLNELHKAKNGLSR